MSRADFELRESTQFAKIADILKVHDFNFIERLRKQVESLKGTNNMLIKAFDGSDSVISEKTWDAALLACGAVIEAVDEVMVGGFRNAFCATRPPGHHAGIFGKTFHADDECGEKATSNGFCFINNVSVAAAYAKSRYRDTIKKIAIVDFDVHHGNGTQETVEVLRGPKMFAVTAGESSSVFQTVDLIQKQYKPWLDYDDA